MGNSDQAMGQIPELLPVEQSELLPCPFCGMRLSKPKPVLGSPELFRFHPGVVTDNDCVLSGRGFGEADLTAWNARSHAIHEPASVMREEAAMDGETLDQFADRIVGKVRRALLDRLDDDVIGDLRDSHLIFARHCVKDAVWTAMREMGSALANLPLSDGEREGAGLTPPLTNGA